MNIHELHIDHVAPALAAVLGIGVMLATIFRVMLPPQTQAPVKLLGCLMVLAMVFAANDQMTYPLGIFIVATQMTNLDFLETLAALFTKDKSYWASRARHRRRHRGRSGKISRIGRTRRLSCRIDQAAFTSLNKSGWRSSTLSSFTNASGGLVLPVS